MKRSDSRRMLLTLVLGSVGLLCLAGAHGQQSSTTQPDVTQPQGGPPRGGPPTPAQELQHLTHALGLTTEQQASILLILQKRHEQMEALRQGQASQAAGREEAHSVMETAQAGIRAVLTEAQQQVFDKMRPPHPPGDGRGPGGPEGGPDTGDAPPPPPSA